ncbi:MAG TPA: DUF6600 domain-containing protein, partial [Nitrospirota bacterium]
GGNMLKMFNIISVTALSALMASGAFFVNPAIGADYGGVDEAGTSAAYASYLKGEVLFFSPDTREWAAASPNYTFREGDSVWAGDDAKAEIKFSGGPTAWLNYKTELEVLEMDSFNETYRLSIPSGEASFRVRDFSRNKAVFQVDTPNASVRAYGKARFRVSTTSDGSTLVGVSKGAVEVESQEGLTNLNEGDLLEVDASGTPSISGLPEPDSWDKWVASRTMKFERGSRSAEYLPEGLRDNAYEFDNGGRWFNQEGYGYVWAPEVPQTWSPYSNGRWVYGADDFVWVSFDPWYTVFHYGRWMWTPMVGWYWIPPGPPDIFWSPGYVSWVWGPDRLYWLPLGPSEPYIGYGYYGPANINFNRAKIRTTTNIFINSNAPNAVSSIDSHAFALGQARVARVTDPSANPFRNKGVNGTRIIARPPVKEVRPTRASRLPKPDVKPSAAALPPRQVETRAAETRSRVIARDPKASAFNPKRRPRVIEDVKKAAPAAIVPTRPAPETRRAPETRPLPETRPAPEKRRVPEGRPAPEKRLAPETKPVPSAPSPSREDRAKPRTFERRRDGDIHAPSEPRRNEQIRPAPEAARPAPEPTPPPVKEERRGIEKRDSKPEFRPVQKIEKQRKETPVQNPDSRIERRPEPGPARVDAAPAPRPEARPAPDRRPGVKPAPTPKPEPKIAPKPVPKPEVESAPPPKTDQPEKPGKPERPGERD